MGADKRYYISDGEHTVIVEVGLPVGIVMKKGSGIIGSFFIYRTRSISEGLRQAIEEFGELVEGKKISARDALSNMKASSAPMDSIFLMEYYIKEEAEGEAINTPFLRVRACRNRRSGKVHYAVESVMLCVTDSTA